jgi:hypothetical protein
MFQKSLLKNFIKPFNAPNSNMINWVYTNSFININIKPTDLEKLPIPNIAKEAQKLFIYLANTIIESKEKIKKYNKYFESLNTVNKIGIINEK